MFELRDDVLVWMDLEMTGLDPDNCAIVEMAIILTDTNLKQLEDPLEVVIWQPDSVLETMIPFVRKMHQNSGLLEKIRRSDVNIDEAEKMALKLVTRFSKYGTARLAGNSISQDRRFLFRYMPRLEGYLHYRNLDVSTVKELGKWWFNTKYAKSSLGQHTALFDIEQSIEELRYFRKKIFLNK